MPERGSITLITGSMFAGKSEELVRLLKRATIAKRSCVAFRPERDSRQQHVKSRAGSTFEARCVAHASEIPALAEGFDTVGIDEAQFFEEDLRDAVFQMGRRGQHVFVAALSADFAAQPFRSVAPLYAIATELHPVHAICMKCGEEAAFSQRLVRSTEKFLVGDAEYEARCLSCYEPPSS